MAEVSANEGLDAQGATVTSLWLIRSKSEEKTLKQNSLYEGVVMFAYPNYKVTSSSILPREKMDRLVQCSAH